MNKTLMIGLTPPEEGGSERHIYELSSRIKGCWVLTQNGSICRNKIELTTPRNNIFLRNIIFALLCYIYSIKLLFVKKYSTVHIHENLLYFLAPILRFRYRVIITVHGIKGFKFYDSKFRWYFFRLALRSAHKLIAVNKEDEKILAREFKNKVIYVPNGVDLGKYKKVNSTVRKKILFIGRIHQQKGIIFLLEAFNSLTKKHPDFSLEIIGDVNDYAKELQKKFKSQRIIWRGYISDRAEIIRSLKSSYCIALPSLWEGLPLTLFEALASGRPVVISDIPAFRSVIRDEAVFVRSKNSKDLAKGIEGLIRNIKKASELGKKGGELAKKYDWDSIAKRTESVYKN